MWDGHPFLLPNIETIVIFKNIFVVPSVNNEFITVCYHVAECPAIRQSLLETGYCELRVKFSQGIVELVSAFPSKDIDVVADGAHVVTLHSLIRQIELFI